MHGFAAPLGGMFPIPHGTACAALLPSVARVNVRALRAREPSSPALERYDEVARIVTGKRDARAEDAATWLEGLVVELDVPKLGTFGVREEDIARVVSAARRASSMKGNPIGLTDDELGEVLGAAI